MEPGFSRSDSPAEPAGNLRTTAAAGSDQGNHAGSGRGNPRTGGRAGDGQCPSFLLSNINRLITPPGHNKVGFLFDQAVRHNALFVGVTETWLHSGVLDAEVAHGFPGYSLHRSDRAGGRQGGGVAL